MNSLKGTLSRGGAGLVLGLFAVAAQADMVTTNLFYTTFAGGTNVHTANVTLSGSSLTVNTNSGLTSTAGADGIIFLPNGHLAIAGQGGGGFPGQVHEITTGGAAVANASDPFNGNTFNGAYHFALNGNSTSLYNLCNGQCGANLTQMNLSGSGGVVDLSTGTNISVTVSGTGSNDVRGLIFDPGNSTWYYGTAGDGSTAGDFGTVSFSGTTATLTRLLSNVPAHGLTYDPFTGDIMFSSGDEIAQFDPTSGTIVSTLTLDPSFGNAFDQSAADGKGHLFVASNNGLLYGLDYDSAAGHLIGNGTDGFAFLASALDDIAPLSGSGSHVPEPGSLALLALGLAGLGFSRRKK